jgi:hypothetical protein
MAIGRILARIVLLIVFRNCLKGKKQFSGFIIMLPALIFALWNVFDHFMTNGEFHPFTAEILLLGLAPALTDHRQDILRLQALQPKTKKESSLE